MNIPNKLKVGGFYYKIIKNHKFPVKNELIGETSHCELEIRLSAEYRNEGTKYAPEKIEEAFIHEVIHTIDSVYNRQDLGEDTVDKLSQGLYQVIKDNPKLFK